MTSTKTEGWMKHYPLALVREIAAGGPDTPEESQQVALDELERRGYGPKMALYGVLGAGGKSAHLLRFTAWNTPEHDDNDTHGAAICGAKGDIKRRVEADERAEIAGGINVCGKCRQRYDNGDTAVVLVNHKRRLPSRPKGAATMAKTKTQKAAAARTRKPAARKPASTRTKTASEPLLDPSSYGKRSIDRLRQERTTINNRLSGLGTQIKRHELAGNTDKARQAEARRDALLDQRQQLTDAIAEKAAGKATTTAHSSRRAATRRGR